MLRDSLGYPSLNGFNILEDPFIVYSISEHIFFSSRAFQSLSALFVGFNAPITRSPFPHSTLSLSTATRLFRVTEHRGIS